jgi:hypothetical protein
MPQLMRSEKDVELWTNYFDIVILPPPPIRDYAIDLSARLKKYGGRFVLGKRRYIPHISLYHIPVRPENFPAFREEVETITERFNGGELKLRSIELPLLMTDKPKWIQQLHLDIVKKTSKYFDWDYGAETSWNMDLLPANLRVRAKGYLEKYGTPMIGAVFRPHITLTSFEDRSIVDEIPALPFKPMSFQVDTIYICELGHSHSCQRVVAKMS